MTCEFLPPTLSTRRARVAALIASAKSVLRCCTRESEIVMLDGSTVTASEFAALVATAKRHDGMVTRATQRHIDEILTLAGEPPTYEERRLAALRPVPVETPDTAATRFKGGCLIALIAFGALGTVMIVGQDTSRRTDATLAQAERAGCIEYTKEFC